MLPTVSVRDKMAIAQLKLLSTHECTGAGLLCFRTIVCRCTHMHVHAQERALANFWRPFAYISVVTALMNCCLICSFSWVPVSASVLDPHEWPILPWLCLNAICPDLSDDLAWLYILLCLLLICLVLHCLPLLKSWTFSVCYPGLYLTICCWPGSSDLASS